MSVQSIASNFNQYFKVHFVNTMSLSKIAHKIRHDVYCKELNWEQANVSEQEIDAYDPYSQHCLLQHRRSGVFAGCVRLIIPPQNDFEKLPCFQHYSSGTFEHLNNSPQVSTEKIGEISRLAVTEGFRRRKSEKKSPFILACNNALQKVTFSKDEMRSFPNIAIGLYLSALVLGEINNTTAISVMMEPKLNKRLERTGFRFNKISSDIEHNGKRATYLIEKSNYTANLSPEFLELYALISQDIRRQIKPNIIIDQNITMSV